MKNGAELLCETLLANNIDVCFANPGTSEMHFVAALDKKPEMRCILGLFEGVVTGAADGYARMADKPASTLLHLGPGLANGLANLHNAKKAQTPIVNIVGDHATRHLKFDAPLTCDVEAVARPMSDWVKRTDSVSALEADTHEAIQTACSHPGKVATLILPADVAWASTEGLARIQNTKTPASPGVVSADGVISAASIIKSPEPTLLLLGSRALREKSLKIAGQIAKKFGVDLLAETSNARMQRGRGRTPINRLPYPVQAALGTLRKYKHIVLIGSKDPVAFFAYPGMPSLLRPEHCKVVNFAGPEHDLEHALTQLADELDISPAAASLAALPAACYDIASGKLDAHAVSSLVAKFLPENAIVCDESITQGRDFPIASIHSAPHDYLQLTGGAIGIGLPLATGASVACPDRKVVNLQADGSAMYTVQALWTQARENLNCLTIIYANRTYQTLHGEMKNVGVSTWGNNAKRMLDLVDPSLDWVHLAKGLGVEAISATTVEGFTQALQAGLAQRGPFLIEALI